MMRGNPNQLARQIEQMQAKALKAQEELGAETVEASVGGGVVTIVMNGHQVVQSVTIDPEALDPDDVETLQDLMLAAFNEGIRKSQELAAQKMSAVTGGIKIPGLM